MSERRLFRHRVGRVLFALTVGTLVAVFSYRWITDPAPRAERVEQENVVLAARELLTSKVGSVSLEVVDPMSPNRKIGKAYVYRAGHRWEVSGFYRRSEADRWHPYLMDLSNDLELISVKINDDSLRERAATDALLTIL